MKLNHDLSTLGQTRQETETTINEMMRLTESMVSEKEGLEVAYNKQRQAMAQIMLVRSQEVKLINEWQEKIKVSLFLIKLFLSADAPMHYQITDDEGRV